MAYILQDLIHSAKLEALTRDVGRICQQTATFLKQERSNFSPSRIEQKGLNDLVSYVDREAEQMTIAKLQLLLPEAGFITEEGTVSASDGRTNPGSGTYWIIDPLDGTTNYIHGLSLYSISVGLLHEGELMIGCVIIPVTKEVYLAWKNGGAWLNDKPIHVSQAATFSQSLIATGFPYQKFDEMPQYLSVLEELMHHTHGLRRMGSAAVDLAWTAAGRFEGFFEYNLKAWDCAGGILLVQEAGGTVSDFQGGTDYLFGGQIIAAGPVYPHLLKLIKDNWHPKN